MVNLEWYRTFKAIYQSGTLTKAAQELLISQPNVSIQLASLESYIGHPLFIRLPRKMVPTEHGKQLYTRIVESIDNLERVEAEFKKSVLNRTPDIRLGTPSEIFSSYLSKNLKLLKCPLIVRYGLADELSDLLVNNELDIAIITQQTRKEDFITYEPIFTESFFVVCNSYFDKSEFDNLLKTEDISKTEKWLREQSWYAYHSNLPLIRRFWLENFRKRPIIKIRAAIPDNNAILNAVGNSDGLAVVSDLIIGDISERKEVKILWKGIAPTTNTLYLGYNKNKIQPQLIDEIRNFIKVSLSDVKTI